MTRLADLSPTDSILRLGSKAQINKLNPTMTWVLVALARAHEEGLAYLSRAELRQRLVAPQAAENMAAGSFLSMATVVYDEAAGSVALPHVRFLMVQKRGTGEKTATYSLTDLGTDVLYEFMRLNPQWAAFAWPNKKL